MRSSRLYRLITLFLLIQSCHREPSSDSQVQTIEAVSNELDIEIKVDYSLSNDTAVYELTINDQDIFYKSYYRLLGGFIAYKYSLNPPLPNYLKIKFINHLFNINASIVYSKNEMLEYSNRNIQNRKYKVLIYILKNVKGDKLYVFDEVYSQARMYVNDSLPPRFLDLILGDHPKLDGEQMEVIDFIYAYLADNEYSEADNLSEIANILFGFELVYFSDNDSVFHRIR